MDGYFPKVLCIYLHNKICCILCECMYGVFSVPTMRVRKVIRNERQWAVLDGCDSASVRVEVWTTSACGNLLPCACSLQNNMNHKFQPNLARICWQFMFNNRTNAP